MTGKPGQEAVMAEEKEKDQSFSFMQEKVKHKPIYQNRMVQKTAGSILCGLLFGLTALCVWSYGTTKLDERAEEQEVIPVEIPKEEETEESEESTVYITETISMELEDYKKMYQQLLQIGSQVQHSLVDISVVRTETDWFDQQLVSQNSVSGTLIADNGLEVLILTDYSMVSDAEQLLVTFYDHTTANAVLKKYDRNTGLAIISVNLSDIDQSTMDVISYADLGSSKNVRAGEPVLAVGRPLGTAGSVLFGNLTSVSQTAALCDGSYNVLTTDISKGSDGSGVLVSWSGSIIGLIQNEYEVIGQNGTVQAYGISDMKNIIEHLSQNQDIAYMGIHGADVTTAISEAEQIPVGVYVSQVEMGSPAIEAGIQPGDIITVMSGQTITNQKDIMTTLLKCSNGQSVQVVCQRPDKDEYQELEFSVILKTLE
jgi:S1-C subfamily serine protease